MNRNVTALILIVLAGGVYLTFTSAKLDEIKAIKLVNDEYTTAIDNADNLISLRDTVLAQYKDLDEADRIKLDKMLPNTVDNIRLVIDLNDIARRRGLDFKNVKAIAASVAQQQSAPRTQSAGAVLAVPQNNGTIPTPILDTVTVSFSTSATYQQFMDLLRDLEINLRIMDLTHLTVTAGTNGIYDFGVEFKTYWLRQQ